MLERTDAITNGVIEPITFVLAYPTVYRFLNFLCMHIRRFVCAIRWPRWTARNPQADS